LPVKFSIAADFGNVHGVYKPGNVKLTPTILGGAHKFFEATDGKHMLPQGKILTRSNVVGAVKRCWYVQSKLVRTPLNRTPSNACVAAARTRVTKTIVFEQSLHTHY
jgi:hypothetical protein